MATHAKVLAQHQDMTEAEWLELRRRGLGGSDAAAAAGVSRWKSRVTLWADKLGRLAPIEQNEPMLWGKLHEPTLFERFKTLHPELDVRRVEATLQHPDHPWMLANVDGVFRDALGHSGLLEIKTAGHWMARHWEDGIPDDYQLQVQHYLAVLGPEFRYAIVPVLIGGNHYEERVVYRDDERIAWLIEQERELWGYVEREEMPPIDGHDSTAATLAEMWADASDDCITLPTSAAELIRIREEAMEAQKAAEMRRAEAENALKAMLEDHEKGAVGRHLVRWTTVNVNRVDTTRLKKERPDIAEKYSAESSHRRFTVSEVK